MKLTTASPAGLTATFPQKLFGRDEIVTGSCHAPSKPDRTAAWKVPGQLPIQLLQMPDMSGEDFDDEVDGDEWDQLSDMFWNALISCYS